ncbi:MAG: M3 family oligoendopeptidase [Phenylobacterium sp.]
MTAHIPPESLPVWRLDDLYAGREDARLDADLDAAGAANAALLALKGRLVSVRADAASLGDLLAQGVRLFEQATNALWRVGSYASLAASTARSDPDWARFEADIRARSAAIGAESLFFTLEINQLEDAEVDAALTAVPEAARWRPWLRRVRAFRPHELTADLERLLVDRGPAVANWTRLHDETLARMQVRAGRSRLTLPEALNALSDADPARRRQVAGGLSTALGEAAPTLALVLNTLAFEKQVEDRWRRYPDPAAPRHLANEVDPEAVQALETAVSAGYERVSHRYYRLKAKLMGRTALDHWDRNAPLDTGAPRLWSWAEARDVVETSFRDLAPKFADSARDLFEQPWIDARPRPGKQSGAYSHPVIAPHHPYVFMNYMGERRDVLTLAHELGHAVHQRLCSPLGTLLADTPLTLAETASIFGEGLVFERLLAEAGPREKLGLLAGQIEDGLNTVVRQMAFHRFETRFHAARRDGELSAEAIGGLWLEVMGESLGPAVRLNPGYEHYWTYISHFVHAPFYVYAYAFGDLLVRALMEKRREDPLGFVPLYEDLLASGGVRTCVEALARFGLDPRETEFWAAGVRQLERRVDAFETLVG